MQFAGLRHGFPIPAPVPVQPQGMFNPFLGMWSPFPMPQPVEFQQPIPAAQPVHEETELEKIHALRGKSASVLASFSTRYAEIRIPSKTEIYRTLARIHEISQV